MNTDVLEWAGNDPRLQGRNVVSGKYSFTGWYYETDNGRPWRNLFRIQTVSGDCCSIGMRVMTIFRHNINGLHFTRDTQTNGNENVNLAPSVIVMQTSFLNQWYFVGVSQQNQEATLCYAFLSDSTATCIALTPSSTVITFGSTVDSKVFIGDLYYLGIIGKIMDQRYYFNSYKTVVDFTALFSSKKAFLLSLKTNPFSAGCSTCQYSCYQSVTIGLPSSLACTNSCLLFGGLSSVCLPCASGLLSQPFTLNLCLPTCPSGFHGQLMECLFDGLYKLEFTLGELSDTVNGGNGVKAVNGATLGYFPPVFETTDPIPSIHRGYFFSGNQYIQLPPALLATGNAFLFAASVTFSVWLRPQGSSTRTLYSKKDGSNTIFAVRLTSNNYVEFEIGSLSYTHSQSMGDDTWVFLAIIFDSQVAPLKTDVKFFFNGIQHATSFSSSFYIEDQSMTALQVIGASADLLDFYMGYVWRIAIRNYVWSDFSSEFSSPGCPAELSYCLSSCGFLQSPDDPRCTQCPSLCVQGCTTTLECALFYDQYCIVPSDMHSTPCVTCKFGAVYNSFPRKCACDGPFYLDSTTVTCISCDSSCSKCEGGTSSDCIECKDFASLSGPPPSGCQCISDAYFAITSAACRPCWHSCLTCVGEGPSFCSSCKTNAFLLTTPPSECQCSHGFYPNPDASMCLVCARLCKECVSYEACVTCVEKATVREGRCECNDGFFPDADKCALCPLGCLSCSSTECSKCISSFFRLTVECVQTCPKGYNPNPNSECEMSDMSPPSPILTVMPNNTLSVFFDKPMNCTVTSSDISVEIAVSNDEAVEFAWGSPEFQGSQTLLISLYFESLYLPSDSKVTLTFLDPEKVASEEGVAISEFTLTGTLHPFGSTTSNSTGVLLTTSAAQQTAAASKGGVAAGVTTSLVNGNPACLMSLVNQLQLISYIAMSKIPLPTDFASTLAALNVGQILPNPLSRYIPNESDDVSQQPPAFVDDYGINSMLFTSNSMTFIGTSSAILLSYIPIYFLSKVKIQFIAEYFSKMLPSLKWNVLLNLWFTSYLDLGVFSLLQVWNTKNSFGGLLSGASCCLAFVFACAFALTPFCVAFFLLRNFNLIISRSDPEFNKKWGAVFLQFKSKATFASVAFYLVFTSRRFLLATTLIFASDSLVLIASVNTATSLLVRMTLRRVRIC